MSGLKKKIDSMEKGTRVIDLVEVVDVMVSDVVMKMVFGNGIVDHDERVSIMKDGARVPVSKAMRYVKAEGLMRLRSK